MRSLYLTAVFLFFSAIVVAQTGKITGKVINESSAHSLLGATVVLIEKSRTTVTDQNGTFSFSKLEAGVYSVKCSYGGVEKIVESIVVKNNDETNITVSIEEKKEGEVVMRGSYRSKASQETVAALLIVQKNSANTLDGITNQQFRLTPDKGAGDVIKRVSGASIQDDRFAIIRGLNDRYNAAFINGAPLPSTESDRKAFAFDIFPSSILDNLIIYKTATPDKTGEFAGGIIDITTKSILPKSFTSITVGNSYNSAITGDTRYYSENKGKKDWIGVDDGTRAMPDGLPSASVIKNQLSFAEKGELAKKFSDYRWGIKKGTTRPNFNFQISKGFNIERKGKEFVGALFSVNYNRSYSFVGGERNSFDYTFQPGAVPIQRGKYADSIYNDEVVVALLGNIAVKIDNRNTISWKNNLSINTDNRLIKRFGAPDYDADQAAFVKQAVRWYTSNQIFSSQLIGDHQVGSKKAKLNWLAGYSKVNREIPNLSRTSYSGQLPDLDHLTAAVSATPIQTSGTGVMFFSNSNENIKNIKADFTQPYTFMKNSQNFAKIGAGYQQRKRDFASRTLGFSPYDAGGVSFDYSLLALPEDQIFLPEHLGVMKNGQGGFLLNDGTLANSDYDASSSLLHAYVMNDQRFFEDLRVIYGVRMESFNQKLNSVRNLTDTIRMDSTVTDFLPSINIVYALTKKINLRLSYANTVNRPEFRELAPFLFFDNITSFLVEGSDKLKRSKIANYDFRFEFFPGKSQLLSVSGFYKKFDHPIELVSLPNTTSQAIYINTTTAETYGVEAEFRVLLSTLFGIRNEKSFLNKLTLSANAAYIKSEIKLKDSLLGFSPAQLFTDRALQGQSPYLINGSLGYNDEKAGFSTTLSFNRVGDRILIAGTYNTADIYERARTVVDFQLAKSFMKNALELKFTIKDIVAQNFSFYFDFDRSKSYTSEDKYFSSYTAPKIFSLSASLKF